MKLLSPANSVESAYVQIMNGADELYFGGDTDAFRSFSFSGRGKQSPNGEATFVNEQDIAHIVRLAKEKHVKTLFAANFFHLTDFTDKSGVKFKEMFLDYVNMGVDAGCDYIIAGDLGAILLLRESGITTPIVASSFFDITNVEQVMFFKDLGVRRVVISYQVLIDDINIISNTTDIELEIFGHYGCSFYDGCCNMKHCFGESKEDNIGVPCQRRYDFAGEGIDMKNINVFNYALICSICSLPQLIRSGISSLKIVGRSEEKNIIAEVTNTYRKAIDFIQLNPDIDDEKLIINIKKDILPRWWKQGLCLKKSCKYINKEMSGFYIGNSIV